MKARWAMMNGRIGLEGTRGLLVLRKALSFGGRRCLSRLRSNAGYGGVCKEFRQEDFMWPHECGNGSLQVWRIPRRDISYPIFKEGVLFLQCP